MANPLSVFAKVWNKEESKKLISSIQEKYSVEEIVKEQEQETDALKPDSIIQQKDTVTKYPNSICHNQDFDYEELCCEYCNRLFTSILDTTTHEKICKARDVKSRHVKQTTTKTSQTCHICGNTGHLVKDCHVSRFEKEH